MNSQRNQAISIGRNTPCLCGSGRKYKKCCLDTHRSVKSQEQLVQSLAHKVKKDFPDEEVILSTSEALGIEKMSEIILEFAEDMLRQSDTREQEKRAIEVAIIAWNMACLDERTQEDTMNSFLDTMDKKSRAKFKELLMLLIDRKNKFYSDIERWVASYEILNMRDGSLHLNVASLVRPPVD